MREERKLCIFCLQAIERPEVSLVHKEVRPLRGLLHPPPRPAQQGQAVLLLLGAGLRGGAGGKKNNFLKIMELENFFSNFQAGLVKCPGCKCAYPVEGWASRHEAECRRKKYPANNNNNNSNNNNSSRSDILGCKSKKEAVVKMKKLMLPPPAKKQRTTEVENAEERSQEEEVGAGDDEQEEGEEVEEEEEEERRIEDEALRDAVVEVEENVGDVGEDVNSSSGGSRKRGRNSNSNSAGQEVQPLSKFCPAASTTTSSDRHHQQEQQQHRPFVIKIKRDEEGEASKDLRPQAEDDDGDEPAELLLKRCLLMPKCPWCVPARRFLDAKSLTQHVEGVHDKSNFIKLFAHSMYRSCLLLYIYR